MSSGPTISHETLDFLYEVITPSSERQLVTAEAFDTKATQLFSVATIIIGLTAASGRLTEGAADLLIAGSVVYVGVVAACVYALWIRRLRVTRHADVLWDQYRSRPVSEIKLALAKDAGEAYSHNKGVLRDKKIGVIVALIGTGLEAILVVAAVVLYPVWTA